MKKIELLAPAGNMEALTAAIHAGCDAVYLGGNAFGARNFAGNFTETELKEAVEYCHLYGVKIYITVNTLIYDDEIELFMNYIDFLVSIHVDALIIQDIGMTDLIHQTYPEMELHASTQMHIHNLDGVRFAEKLGMRRVVLARETDIETVVAIRKQTDLEIELFVHGALCLSYSGQCLMSSLIGNRSGNRGTCAGSCRQKYDLVKRVGDTLHKLNKEEYLLSTKDLNTLEYVKELIESGIDSFKIEGRMKRPEYVYQVVSLYRKAIDSYYETGKVEINLKEIEKLKSIFNREFTKGFLFHEKNEDIVNQYRPNHLGVPIGTVVDFKSGHVTVQLTGPVQIKDGIRIISNDSEDTGCYLNDFYQDKNLLKEAKAGDKITFEIHGEVEVGSRVIKTVDEKVINEMNEWMRTHRRFVPITGTLTLKIDEPMTFTLTDGIHTVTSTSIETCQKPLKMVTEVTRIEEQLHKFGGTSYRLEALEIVGDKEVFVPIKALNELRRMAKEQLDKKRLDRALLEKKEYLREVPNFEHALAYHVAISTMDDYEAIKQYPFTHIYVEDDVLFEQLKEDDRVIKKYSRVMEQYQENSNMVLVSEVGGVEHFKEMLVSNTCNVTNHYTVAYLHSHGAKQVGLSLEMTKEQIDALVFHYEQQFNKKPNLELMIYGYVEVMVSKFDLMRQYHVLNEHCYLKDRFHNLYHIQSRNNQMHLYHYERRNIEAIEDYHMIGINSFLIELLEENDKEILEEFFLKRNN